MWQPRPLPDCNLNVKLLHYTEISATCLSNLHGHNCFSHLLRTCAVVGGINSQFSRNFSKVTRDECVRENKLFIKPKLFNNKRTTGSSLKIVEGQVEAQSL